VILQLLAAGHQLRTTVRSLARAADVRAALKAGGAEPGDRLSFFAADLLADDGWAAAVAGSEYVMHVASPLPVHAPKHEDELILPAREGTLRVLRAARDAQVRRVVVTSSFGAVGYGHPPRVGPFDETDWTNVAGPNVQPYIKSKTLAERAAWDFVAAEGGGLELAVVNPVAVLGPPLGADLSASLMLIRGLLNGRVPAIPKVTFGVVDVRDVADLHLRAMADPAARGERFIAVSEFLSLGEIASVLRARMGPSAAKVPRLQVPDWLVRLVALWSPAARAAVPQLGVPRSANSEKARRVLGWVPRPAEEAIVATAEGLVRLELVGKRR
jgi:dihydroflavonol-4-reductase